ncbi:DUF4283 domain-containing protein, partial [Cephalotus follicularis]
HLGKQKRWSPWRSTHRHRRHLQ